MRFKLPPGTGLCAQDVNDVTDAMKKEIERLEGMEAGLEFRLRDRDASISRYGAELSAARTEIACMREDMSDLTIARRAARTSMQCLREILGKGLICSWTQHPDGSVAVDYFPFTADDRARLEEETKRANSNAERADEAMRLYNLELETCKSMIRMCEQQREAIARRENENKNQRETIVKLQAENARLAEINARSPAMVQAADAISAPRVEAPLNGWTVARLADRMMNNAKQRIPDSGPLPRTMYEVMADAILASHGVAR